MQRLITLLLIAALIVPATMKVVILATYVIDYDTYVRELCENRDQPELKCNGTCHLAKELKVVNEAKPDSNYPVVPVELQKDLVFTVHLENFEWVGPYTNRAGWAQGHTHSWKSLHAEIALPPPRA